MRGPDFDPDDLPTDEEMDCLYFDVAGDHQYCFHSDDDDSDIIVFESQLDTV